MSRTALQNRSFRSTPSLKNSLRSSMQRFGNRAGLLEGLESRVLMSAAPLPGDFMKHHGKEAPKPVVDHAPTESFLGVLPGSALPGSSLAISYNAVVAASNAKDADGDKISFTIETVSDAGTLTITHNGTTSPVVAGTTVFADGDTLAWSPAAGHAGKRYAFSVLAGDGKLSAAHQAALFATAADLPKVTVDTRRSEASSSKPGTIVISRTGDTKLALTVNFTTATGTGFGTQGTDYVLKDSSGNVLTNSYTLAAGQHCAIISVFAIDDGATGKLKAKLDLVAGSGYKTQDHGCDSTASVRLIIGASTTPVTPPSPPVAPTIANPAVNTSIDFGTALSLTFDQLVTMTGAALGSGDPGPLQLEISDEVAGVLRIQHGSSAAVGANIGDLVSEGDTLTWTPPIGAISNGIEAFSLIAQSGSLDSSGTSDFTVAITV